MNLKWAPAAIVLTLPVLGVADTGTAVNGSLTDGSSNTVSYSYSDPISCSGEVSDHLVANNVSDSSASIAGGAIHLYANTQNTSSYLGGEADATAHIFASDVQVTGPGTSLISASLNLDLRGTFTGDNNIFISIFDKFGDLKNAFASDGSVLDNGLFPALGPYSDLKQGDNFLTTIPFQFQPGTSNWIWISVSIQAKITSNTQSTIDYGNTISFNPNGPALNLPAGYNVNSQSYDIVNNQYLATPEPQPVVAIALGTGLMLLRRRKHRVDATINE